MKNGVKFRTTGVLSDSVLEKLAAKAQREHQTSDVIRERDAGGFWMVLAQWLPMFLIIGLFMFLMRQLQGRGGRAPMSFGKSRARLLIENQSLSHLYKTWQASMKLRKRLKRIRRIFKNPEKFTRLGGRIPRACLLRAAPGTGRTWLARAIAGEAGVPFLKHRRLRLR